MSSSFLSSLTPTLMVAIGGGIGAAARYQVGLLSIRWAGNSGSLGSTFPWGTLTVNIVGSLIMGAMLGWFAKGGGESENLRVFLVAGLMGGFTTFSAFSAELVTMMHRGQALMAFGYGVGSVALGMIAFLGGLIAMQMAGMGS